MGPAATGPTLPSSGLLPSTALPIRTCVAPDSTACSRSPLIPAEIQVADGSTRRTPAAISASFANAGTGSAPSGATAITPRSRSPSAAATCSASRSHVVGRAPARPLSAPGPGRGRPAPGRRRRRSARWAPADSPRSSLARSTDSHHVGVGRDRCGLVALQPADEVPGQVEVGALGVLGLRLLVAVLPHVPHPEVGEQAHVGGGEELGDHGQRHLVGRAAGAARRRRRSAPRTVSRLRGELVAARVGHRSHPDQAGEPSGRGALAPVGEQVLVLDRAARHVGGLDPGGARAGPAPRRRCRATGVPHDVTA